MKNRIYLLALVVLGITFFTSCNNDDELDYDYYPYNRFYSLAMVDNPDKEPSFVFELDNGERMKVQSSNYPYDKPETGVRIFADYSILYDAEKGSHYDYNVYLIDYFPILTKGVFDITPETQDSIGNDLIHVRNMWIGKNYLNVEFSYPGSPNHIHYINLVKDDSKVYEDGKLHLELRHNGRNDFAVKELWGLASFDLSPFKEEGKEAISIVVHWKNFNTPTDRKYELEYKFDMPEKESKPFTVEAEKAKFV